MDTTRSIEIIDKSTIQMVLSKHPPEIKYNILGNRFPYITADILANAGYSLLLIETTDLIIKQARNPEGKIKTRADFKYRSKYSNEAALYTDFSVTDKRFYSIVNDTKYQKAYLIIGIGAVYSNRFYKFIAAIYLGNE
jgi:hypothetical protein